MKQYLINYLILDIFILLPLIIIGVRSLNDGLAQTPPMGWISWARFACEIDCKQYPKQCINEELYKNMIDRIASDGYLEAGYRYVNIDDCWMDKHRDLMTQQLLADRKRFPSGIAWLAKYAHQKNVLFGIYEDAGTLTCAGLPGTFSENIDHTKIDVKTFTSWGIDAVKMDGCYAKNLPYNQTYPSYSQTLKKSGHDFLFECSWPAYIQNVTDEEYELIKKNCHYWRNFDDITDSWSSVLSIIDFYGQNNDQFRKFHGPGGWFDPDMLIIGNNGLSYEQSKAQMAFWCMWSAPLFMSNDLRTIRPELKEILLNKELIAINQDPLGLMAKLINKQPKKKFEIWIKKLAPLRKNGLNPFAVLYFYYGTLGPDKYLSMKLSDMIPNSSNSTYTYNCYDLYQNYKHLATLKSNEQLRLLVPMGGAVRLVKLVPVTKS